MHRERIREGLRENIRLQVEARQQQQQRDQHARQPEQAAGESADVALLRQFLTEREVDGCGQFCAFLACELRKLHPTVCGMVMT